MNSFARALNPESPDDRFLDCIRPAAADELSAARAAEFQSSRSQIARATARGFMIRVLTDARVSC
jgi:hypothetical protein